MGVEEIDFEVVFQSWSFKFLWKVVIKIFQNEKRNKKIVNFRVTCWSDVTREAGILRSMLELLLTVNLQIYIYVLRNSIFREVTIRYLMNSQSEARQFFVQPMREQK